MIRLGSLAGYPFEGPRVLAGWTAPASPGVYAIAYRPEPDGRPDRYAIIHVGHADDLSTEGFPFRHRAAPCWIERAGNRFAVLICTYDVPGGQRGHREQIARELVAHYEPGCNQERFRTAWQDQWIGNYSAPTTAPLTTTRDLDSNDDRPGDARGEPLDLRGKQEDEHA